MATSTTAADTLVKIRTAADAGCAVAMVSPPWYIMPGPDEIMAHYKKILAATPLPVLLYNIPRRTGVGFTVEMVDRLADEPNVIGIKESSKDWGLLSSVIRRTRDRISVFAGYASFFGLAALCEGAVETLALDIHNGRIAAIYSVRNPDKLGHLARSMASH